MLPPEPGQDLQALACLEGGRESKLSSRRRGRAHRRIPVPSGMVTTSATGHLSVTKTQSSPRHLHRPLVKHTAASGAPEGDSLYHRQKWVGHAGRHVPRRALSVCPQPRATGSIPDLPISQEGRSRQLVLKGTGEERQDPLRPGGQAAATLSPPDGAPDRAGAPDEQRGRGRGRGSGREGRGPTWQPPAALTHVRTHSRTPLCAHLPPSLSLCLSVSLSLPPPPSLRLTLAVIIAFGNNSPYTTRTSRRTEAALRTPRTDRRTHRQSIFVI